MTLFTASGASAQTFRVALWNVKSGFGQERVLDGRELFDTSSNCAINAWGSGAVPRELTENVKNDPLVVALVVNESWTCATPNAIAGVLTGWTISKTSSGDPGERNGDSVLARYGFSSTPVPTRIQVGVKNPDGSWQQEDRWVWHAVVWLDSAHTKSFDVYGTHLDSAAKNGAEVVNVMAPSRDANKPHAVFGDMNTRLAVSNCGSLDNIDMFTAAGYQDGWAVAHPGDPGYTGTLNRYSDANGHWCGIPTGVGYKRIDLGLFRGPDLTVTSATHLFAQAAPKDDAPSDHYGVVFELRLGAVADNPPTVTISSPSSGASVSGTANVSVSAGDDVAVNSVELRVDNTLIKTWTAAPYTMSWDTTTVANGAHTLKATAYDSTGHTTSDSIPVSVTNGTAGGAFWTATVNATQTGTTLQKTAGCSTCLDAGGVSVDTIASGDGSITFTPSTASRLYAGLGTDRTSSTDVTHIQYAFSFWSDGNWDIRESNVYKGAGSYAAGDVFKVAVESGTVKYYQNGTLVYTSTVPPTYPLGFDATFLTMNSSISNPTITGGAPSGTNVVWVNPINVAVTGNTIQKNGGCATCLDAGAISQQQITSAGGSVTFTPSSGHRLFVGLGRDTSASTDAAAINFAFSFWESGTWDVRESGVYKTEGTLAPGDVFKVSVEAGVVKYYRNGAVVYTSTAPLTFPLVVDTSLLSPGATVSNATLR